MKQANRVQISNVVDYILFKVKTFRSALIQLSQ